MVAMRSFRSRIDGSMATRLVVSTGQQFAEPKRFGLERSELSDSRFEPRLVDARAGR